MPGRHRRPFDRPLINKRLAGAGVAGLATVFAVAPTAMADPAPTPADSTPTTQPATAGATASATSAPSSDAPSSDAPASGAPSSEVASSDVPSSGVPSSDVPSTGSSSSAATSSDASSASSSASAAAPSDSASSSTTSSSSSSPATPSSANGPLRGAASQAPSQGPTTSLEVSAADYGTNKVRLGVQIKDGAYVPDGTTTTGTILDYVATDLDGNVDFSGNCVTGVAGSDATMPTASFCPGRMSVPAGDTLVVTQQSANPGLVPDPVGVTVPLCENTQPPPLNFCNVDAILVDNGVPPEVSSDFAETAFGEPVDIDVLANDDAHGAPETISATTDPAHGSVEIVGTAAGNPSQYVKYTPDARFAGSDSFTYTLETANGTATATVDVQVDAPAPTAQDDSATTLRGRPVRIDVLANDDAGYDGRLSIDSVGEPDHGQVRIAHGELVYTPADDFVGKDSFPYTVRTAGGTATATVRVEVLPPAPAARNDRASTHSGEAVAIDVTGNDDARGGDALTISGTGSAPHGSVQVHGDSVVYTPQQDFVGTDQFTYTVSTSFGSDTAQVTVRVRAAAPPPPPNHHDQHSDQQNSTPDSNSDTPLADTGVDSAELLGWAGGLLALGSAASVLGRRRRDA